ncbi:adenylate/guanylate cyclase domain-containing protein [Pseudomonas matsuisoli]|uniref:Protein CyaB n=1 Tax=Pseudomonas matsuisoli TaxID=1515666 RepID=A0A917PU33_9PSED|nr:adenylate/guanylate cyclase domain-containing protein [Pseudomonas matsuisoli]GGJ91662.1 protein CyaB [Pseudomonas matsuisoli]
MKTLPPVLESGFLSSGRREYHSRILAYLTFAANVAVGAYLGQYTYALLWTIPYALLYPHIVQHLAYRTARPIADVRSILLLLDGVNVGIGIMSIGLTLVPSSMLLLTLAFASLVNGGMRCMGLTLLTAASTCIFTSALLKPPVHLTTLPGVAVVSIFFTALNLLLTAYAIHLLVQHVTAFRNQVREEKEKAGRLSQDLAKYLSPQVWKLIFDGRRNVRLETQRKKLTVFFSDIKGFTELSEELEAEALTDLLNTYLDEMSKIALKHGGTIDKFVGDSVMVFFGDPATQGSKNDAQAAVAMAIDMRKHMKVLWQQWRAQGINRPLEIRMGINTGYCTVGNFGAATRMDYTIIGREVNLASRLENAAEAGEILISHETYSLVKDVIMCRDKGQITVKGFSRPVQIYQVVDFRRDLGASSSYVEHEVQGFSMYLDTNSIQTYDKQRVIEALTQAAEKLRDKVL